MDVLVASRRVAQQPGLLRHQREPSQVPPSVERLGFGQGGPLGAPPFRLVTGTRQVGRLGR